MKRSLYLVIFFGLSGCSCATGLPTRPLPPEQLRQFQACHHTSECIRVDNGCCDCGNGGDTVAINRKFEKKFRDNFLCDRLLCSQHANPCAFLEPVCKNGLCELGPQQNLFPKK